MKHGHTFGNGKPIGGIKFSEKQMDDLDKKGRTTGRAKAYAYGTAKDGMSAHAGIFHSYSPSSLKNPITPSYSNNVSYNNTTDRATANETKSSMEKLKEWFNSFFDWIEIKLDTWQSKADAFYNSAQKYITKGLSNSTGTASNNTNYNNALKELQNSINTLTQLANYNAQGAYRYQTQANSVYVKGRKSLNANDQKKLDTAVKTIKAGGTINITSYGEDLRTVIEEYQEWYNKSIECQSAIADINKTISEQRKELYELPLTQATQKIEKLTKAAESLNAVLGISKKGQSSISQYGDLINSVAKELGSLSSYTDDIKIGSNQASYKLANELEKEVLNNREFVYNANKEAYEKEVKYNSSALSSYDTAKKNYDTLSTKLTNSYSKATASVKKNVANRKLADGTYSTTGLSTTSGWYKLLTQYNSALNTYRKSVDNLSASEEALSTAENEMVQSTSELAEARIQYVQNVFENTKNYYENYIEWLNSAEDKLKAFGDYSNVIYSNGIFSGDGIEQIEKYKQELSELLDVLNSNDYVSKDSEEYRELERQINQTQSKIYELEDAARTNALETMFERAVNKSEQLINKIKTITGLLTDNMMFDKDGVLTKLGQLKFTLDNKSLVDAQKNLNDIIDEREQVLSYYNSKHGSDYVYGVDSIIDEQLKGIDEKIQSSLQTVASYYQSLIDTIEKVAEKEKESLLDVIDVRQKALDKKKEYYDYDKKLNKSNTEINLLKQQIDALSGSTNKDDLTKLQKLNAELAEKEQDKQETIEEHLFDMMGDSLDELKDQINKNYEDYKKFIESSFANMTDAIKGFESQSGLNSDEVIKEIRNVITGIGVLNSNVQGSGLVNPSDYSSIPGHASGSKRAMEALAWTQENGAEIIRRSDGAILTPMKGATVFTKEMTENLWKMASMYPNIKTTRDALTVDRVNMNNISPVIECPITIMGNANEAEVKSAIVKMIPEINRSVQNSIRQDLRKNGNK